MMEFTNEETITIGIIIGMMIFYLVLMLLELVNYIFTSLALQRIAKRRCIPNEWMAWLPYASSFLMGNIADEYDGKNGIKRKWKMVLLVLDIVLTIIGVVGYIGILVWTIANTAQLETADMAEAMSLGLGAFAIMYIWCFVVIILAMIRIICGSICVYKIYESTVPERAVTYMILSMSVPLAGAICLFTSRNKGYANEYVYQPYMTYMPYAPVEPTVVSQEPISQEAGVQEPAVQENLTQGTEICAEELATEPSEE